MRTSQSLVWVLALIATAGYGALYYAQPLLAVATEHATGWTRAQTSLAFTLALLTNAALAPLVGRWLDQWGGRALISGGALLGAGALIALSITNSYPMFVLSWMLIGAAMTLTFYEAVFTVLAQHHQGPDRLRTTLTVTLIAGLASTIFVPLTTAFLSGGGLPLALRGLAGILLAVAVLGRFMLPNGGHPRVKAVWVPFRPDRMFLRLTIAFTLARIVSVGVWLQLAPLFLSGGVTPAVAAVLAGAMGLASLPGRALFMPLLARLRIYRLTMLLMVTLGLGPLLLTVTHRLLPAALAITLFGLANGALTLARTELLVSSYGPEVFGTVNGRLTLPVNLSQALTPCAAGLLFSWTGHYWPSMVLFAGLAALAAWTTCTLPRRLEQNGSKPSPS